jgi:putative oxidoreductase
LWSVKALQAAALLAAGGAKLAGVPMMIQTFEHVGVGQWFRYVTGSLEVIGAVTVLVPGVAGLGAALLAAILWAADRLSAMRDAYGRFSRT